MQRMPNEEKEAILRQIYYDTEHGFGSIYETYKQARNGFRYAFVAVDVSSKYMWAVPCKDKQPNESMRAFTEALDQIGTPKQIYHDNEGAWDSTKFIKLSLTSLQTPRE